MPQDSQPYLRRLLEVAVLMLKIGVTGFGGPAAHIAMLHDEVVERRKWVTEQHFLDLLGATNLVPGPNSTEMTIHLGYVRAGWPGLVVGGLGFITPAMLIVIVLAWAYTTFGQVPAVNALLYGIKPVVIAIVVKAIWGLGTKAVKGPLTVVVGIAVLVLAMLNVNLIAILVGGGVVVMMLVNARRLAEQRGAHMVVLPLLGISLPVTAAAVAKPFSQGLLFITFLKIGSVLYGSGYTLLAFLESDLVQSLGWLTTDQIIDAVAIGQMTPGPVSTTATFIGYLLGGVPGAVVATLGIFLPAFVVVGISSPVIPHLRTSPWASAFLDGVNVAALGLMTSVTIDLARAAFIDPVTVFAGIAAAALILKFDLNSMWLIAGGAVMGLVTMLLGG